MACDARDQAAVDAAVAEAVGRLGGLDVLIDDAGLGTPQSAGEPPDPPRRTGVALLVARHLPRRAIDRAGRANLRRLARKGHFDGSGLSAPLGERLRQG